MKICHLSSEFTPFIKAGGLADIAHGLSFEFHERGDFVRVMLPYLGLFPELEMTLITNRFEVTWGGKRILCSLHQAFYQGIELLFVDPHDEKYSFKGKPIYGGEHEIEKFMLFSLISVEYLKFEKTAWDVIHCHDWVASLAAILLKESSLSCILTIHNASYQGITTPAVLAKVPSLSLAAQKSLLEKDHVTLLKGGILNATIITTVSPTYREELLTTEEGKNLKPYFESRKKDFFGILNGLDERFWNPTVDPFLPCHFDLDHLSLEQIDQILLWKKLHRQFLQTDIGITTEGPLLVSIGRLVEQKSPELILEAGKTILAKGGVFALLGSTHDLKLEAQFKKEFPSSSRCFLQLGFDERLSHILYAAADMICVPSRFEPCGLTQMIGMRYGAVPIVRRVGGLADTVFDIETSQVPVSKRCGFTFDHDTLQGLHWGLDRAINTYFHNKPLWNNLVLRCMSQNFSWSASGEQYQKLYSSLLASVS